MKSNFFTKELFIETMDVLKKQQEFDNECTDAFQKILPADFVSGYDNQLLWNQLVKLMSLDLKDESDWINYYIYDLDWGNKYKAGMVTNPEGKNVKLKSLDDLWKMLTNK